MEKQVIIGRGNPTGQNVAIGLEARARSTYVIGITGTGKSTLLESMAYQDMANRDGLCYLDPHGDSAQKLLATVPDYREADVIFWDPSAIDRPFGFNPFYCSDPNNELEVSRKAQSFIDALGSLKEFASIFESAPRMKNMLQQLATTFIINQGHTLAETPKFLLDQEYREQFYPALSNRFARIRRYWEEELDSRSDHERREISESSLNKLERFQSDPVLYSIFGQPTNSIDFRKAMDSGAIILINLGADKGGFIGAFVVWELLQAAFSRADIHKQERRPFHLFADEFQTYMTTAFPMLQAQARKYGVDTVIAHQVRAQLTPEIAEITQAVGNLIIFRITSHNADSLATEFDTTPPPAKPVAEVITEPIYEYHTELVWTSQKAEREFKDLEGQYASIVTEAHFLYLCLNKVIERPFGKLEEWGIELSSERLKYLRSLDPTANEYHGELEESFRRLIDVRGLPGLSPFEQSEIVRMFDEREIARKLIAELQRNVTHGWLVAKRDAFAKRMKEIRERTPYLLETYHREQTISRYLYDRPVKVSGSGSEQVSAYRYVEGIPPLRSDVAAGIANQLVGLPNFQARCKITRENKRPSEHLIQTFDYPGIENAEVARRLSAKSSAHYGRDRREVEHAIEERLRNKLETREEGGDPILREKSQAKTYTGAKRPPKISHDQGGP